ncbi:MAG TPA: hypothetical protein VK171_15635 [Fimbriimonas sp.]|nr:hypothetical protein [Fimbriimonas sp.]
MISFLFLAALPHDVITSDNIAVLKCLNAQMKGQPAKCTGVSDWFQKTLSVSDKNPGLRFMLASREADGEVRDVWRYADLSQQRGFLQWIVSQTELPFNDWTVRVETPLPDRNPNTTLFINRRVAGVPDDFTWLAISVNFSNGRISAVDFENRGELFHELETITDATVTSAIEKDGSSYVVLSDEVRWRNPAIGPAFKRLAETTESGKYKLVKMRIVKIMRGDKKKIYNFRMDGSRYFHLGFDQQ